MAAWGDGKGSSAAGSHSATLSIAMAGALFSMLVIFWGTRPLGPGLYGDGAGYLSAAQSLVRSGQLRAIGAPYWSIDSTTFMGQWAPGFSVALAAPMRIGFGVFTSVLLVQMLAAGVTVVLTALLVGRALGPVWAAGAAVAVIATPAVLGTQLNVVSEPLYIAGIAAMLMAMTWRRERPALAGWLAAGLVMVRYLGVAAIAGAGVWAALWPAPLIQRLRRVAIAVLPGVVTYAGWMFIVRRNGGAVRSVIVDRNVVGLIRRLAGATAAWLAPWESGPSGVHVAAKVAIVGLAVAAGAMAMRAPRPVESPSSQSPASNLGVSGDRIIEAAGLLAVCHLAVLCLAQFLDSNVDFSSRVLAPVHYLFTVMAVTALGTAWRDRSRGRVLAAAAVGIWFAGSAVRSAEVLHESRTVGLDHARREDRESPTLGWLQNEGKGLPVYTNEPAKIFYYLHRPSRILPWIATSDTLRHLDEILRDRPGFIVWFVAGKAEAYVPPALLPMAISPEKLTAAIPLAAVATFPDGVVWLRDSAGRPTVAPAR